MNNIKIKFREAKVPEGAKLVPIGGINKMEFDNEKFVILNSNDRKHYMLEITSSEHLGAKQTKCLFYRFIDNKRKYVDISCDIRYIRILGNKMYLNCNKYENLPLIIITREEDALQEIVSSESLINNGYRINEDLLKYNKIKRYGKIVEGCSIVFDEFVGDTGLRRVNSSFMCCFVSEKEDELINISFPVDNLLLEEAEKKAIRLNNKIFTII